MVQSIETRYVFTLTVRIADVTTPATSAMAFAVSFPIIGGEVRGEKVNGKVLPFGADFQIIRPND